MERRTWLPTRGAATPRAAVFLAAMLAMAVALVWTPSPALADDTALGGVAGSYYPLSSTDIRMESETVQAICYRGFAEYRVDFLFVNSGAAQTLQLGFPYEVNPEGDSRGGLIGFRAWQDGTPLAVTIGQGPDTFLEYYLHQATFPTGKTMISVSYLAAPTATSGFRFQALMPKEFAAIPGIMAGDDKYDYWLHTGAGWAGTIGTAVVRFTLADDFRGYGMDVKSSYQNDDHGWGYITQPDSYTKIGGDTFQWLFKDLEPTEADDIQFAFSGLYFYSDVSAPAPAIMGAQIASVTTSNPSVSTTDGFEAWPLLDGSPQSSLGLRGQHPWVKLGLQGDTKIQEIRIVSGNTDSVDAFGQYGRPKTVKITLSDGATKTVTLADESSLQRFPLSGTADWAQLDIIDSYPGTKSTDVYIADVSFANEPSPAFKTFDALIAAATGGTPTTAPPTETSTPATTAPGSTETSAPPATSPATTGTVTTAPAEQDGGIALTLWPIVLYAVAGLALVAAVVLGVLLLRRRG